MVVLTLVAAGSILFVAAQTGFLDGPRILSNMAVDSWAPRRFAQLSDRLVTNNGIVLMGLAAAATLMYTRGSVSSLLVMYAINVFVTFSLTLIGMTRHWWQERGRDSAWKKGFALQGLGAVLCVGILIITVYEKAYEGGWMTIVVTTLLVSLAFAIKRHYLRVRDQLRRLDEQLLDIPVRPHDQEDRQIARDEPVAVMLVNGFSGLGVHTVLSVQTLFPHQYKSYLFVSVGVIDSAIFKGHSEIEALKHHTIEDLEKYVEFAHKLGFKADYRYKIGTEAVDTVVEVCEGVRKRVPTIDLLPGPARFRERPVLLPAAPQRDRVRHSAPAPVRRPSGRRSADPRAGIEEGPEEGLLRPERYSGRSARVISRSTASRGVTPS